MKTLDDVAVVAMAIPIALLWVYALFRGLMRLNRRWGYVNETGDPIGVAKQVPGLRGQIRGERQIVRLLGPAVKPLIGCFVLAGVVRIVLALLD